MSFVIAIDGPAGSGKGTVTEILSKELNLTTIDTGATYRCVSLAMIKKNIDLNEKEKIIELAKKVDIEMKNEKEGTKVFLDGEDVTSKIRIKKVTEIVSQVSAIPEVREEMVKLQRKLAEGKNVIMEGRDITTVVFPNADVKIYLDAEFEKRVERRYLENQEKGIKTTYEEVMENIKFRDHNDKTKKVGALKIAEDAVVLDNSDLSIEETAEAVKAIIKNKINDKL